MFRVITVICFFEERKSTLSAKRLRIRDKMFVTAEPKNHLELV